ncbi:hypothetical protein OIE62_06675 [Streptomyces scopuliridis]|uniref:Uncharacterized protein n=1 Tax=Streptomyces scopuliridis TaxID=452529 RepID=A0ACD4ZT93_9ACTN|nr:hypothetical protein [Streptomyces scopuliridis]WSC01733.1 hypothetical protein OG835_35145 [Streptomyces scopuliridis]WSC04728.1 hypothetical protein OIE62_06675 [Streptomyces scopuliridis]
MLIELGQESADVRVSLLATQFDSQLPKERGTSGRAHGHQPGSSRSGDVAGPFQFA